MKRYLAPAIVYLVALAILFAGAALGPVAALAALAAYAVGSIWWIVRAATAPPPIWPHLIAIWAPALPPAALTAFGVYRSQEVDVAVMIIDAALPVALLALVACGLGALSLAFRRRTVS